MKLTIKDLHTKAGIPIVCEVFNLFADAIPQQGLSRIERGRRRQALVPDFKLRGEEGEGDMLCELKFLNACKSRYPRGYLSNFATGFQKFLFFPRMATLCISLAY